VVLRETFVDLCVTINYTERHEGFTENHGEKQKAAPGTGTAFAGNGIYIWVMSAIRNQR
jgi:hypothetical protein